MPTLRGLVRTLLDRRLPVRTRLGLLTANGRAARGRVGVFGVPYGAGRVYLTGADYAVDRASFSFAVTEANYATSYDDAIVLDIGAHKGYYAAYALAHGAWAVVTYEPESANLAVLERTAVGYRSTGAIWEVRPAAVDARAGRAQLHVMRSSWGHALEPPESFAEHEVAVATVEVVALETAIADASALDRDRRLVVKINIEGAECSAILGTPPTAWDAVDEVFVETHPWAPCDADDLASELRKAGLSRLPSAHPAVLRMHRAGSPPPGPRSAST